MVLGQICLMSLVAMTLLLEIDCLACLLSFEKLDCRTLKVCNLLFARRRHTPRLVLKIEF